LVPDIGGFANVSVIEVHVKPGDSLEKEAAMITIETEKAAMDVPAPAAGRVAELKVKAGDKVSEGSVILLLESAAAVPGADVPRTDAPRTDAPRNDAPRNDATGAAVPAAGGSSVDPPAAATAPASPPPSASTPPPPAAVAARAASVAPPPASVAAVVDEVAFSRAYASPSVRKFARELGADLGEVKGTGPKGRITQDDVKAHVKQLLTTPAAPPGAGGGLPRIAEVDFAKFGEVEVKPLSRIQKISGARLQASWLNLPHVTQYDDADITDLEATRAALKTKAAEQGVKLTPLAFIIRACVLALKEFPRFNSSLDASGNNLVLKKYFHVGFAADTPNGLVVPVVRDADRSNVYELARTLAEMSEKARAGKLRASEMQGGSFTISSLGGIGGTAFTPIINAPEVAILGVAKSSLKPVYDRGAFLPRLMLPLCLSYDHRVIDGAEAARFIVFLSKTLADVKALL
jgi:pyruvate dehydrogenase E2 component (dihydrolipoamide acetyltransferase)